MNGAKVQLGAPVRDGAHVDPSYYEEGARWETSIYRNVTISRNAWRIVAVLAAAGLAVSLGVLWALVPLKSVEVVTLLVDKTTGFVEVAKPLEAGGPLSQREAVTRANVVRFVRARETYDPRALRDNFELAALYSTSQAARDLQAEFSSANSSNPMRKYGPETRIAVFVKSIVFLNEKTAAVRFDTIRTSERDPTKVETPWVANVRFRYTSEPLKNDYRFDNPLGFQVSEYRRDQETAGPAETKQ